MVLALLAITLFSLGLTLTLAIVIWRLLREERNRSAARVAALASAMQSEPAVGSEMDVMVRRAVHDSSRDIALDNEPFEAAAADIPQESALQVFASEQAFSERAAARTKTADAGPSSAVPFARRPRASSARPATVSAASPSPSAGSILFAGSGHSISRGAEDCEAASPIAIGTPPPTRIARSRLPAAILAVAFLIVTVGGALIWTRGLLVAPTAAPVEATRPLELTSLRHVRSGAALSISGLVRNHKDSLPAEKLVAVAYLFDGNGGFITSGRAPLEIVRLDPGDESPFAIRIDNAGAVARYRVSFRNEGRSAVPHVDRRESSPGTHVVNH